MFNKASIIILVCKVYQTLKAQGDRGRFCSRFLQKKTYAQKLGFLRKGHILYLFTFISYVFQIFVRGSSLGAISIKISWLVCKNRESINEI